MTTPIPDRRNLAKPPPRAGRRLHDIDEVETEAARVRLEAESKLVEWRREFILQRIPERVPGTPAVGVATDSSAWTNVVKECRRVLDDALDNRYRKLGLLRYRLQWSALSLIVSLLTALAAWLIAVNHGLNPSTATSLLSDWRSVLVVLSLGALGASLSGLLSIRGGHTAKVASTVRPAFVTSVTRPTLSRRPHRPDSNGKWV